MKNLEVVKYLHELIFELLNDANKKGACMNPEQAVQFQLLLKIVNEVKQ